jgi:hypothetical protein
MRPPKFFILAIVRGNCGWLWLIVKLRRKLLCKQLLYNLKAISFVEVNAHMTVIRCTCVYEDCHIVT